MNCVIRSLLRTGPPGVQSETIDRLDYLIGSLADTYVYCYTWMRRVISKYLMAVSPPPKKKLHHNLYVSRDSVVHIAASVWTEWSGVRIPAGTRSLSCPKCTERLWGPSGLLFGGYRGPFPGVKRPGLDVDHSAPSGVEVKNEWSYSSASSIRLYGADRDNFAFLRVYLYLICKVFSSKARCCLWE
jgi:hypothetical protein